MNYPDFFIQATGFPPFPFQVRYQARDRQFTTHTLIAPTGLGKTECVTVDWLYGILYERPITPTRLVISLPMRSLTHQTYERVQGILARISQASDISLHKLVGGTGESIDRDWLDCIDRPAIIIGTQDQILSRQLCKAYAASRWEWPVHAALLNNDVRIIIDETQLQGVGYQTAFLLQKFALEQGTIGLRELILCSATLDTSRLVAHRIAYQELAIGSDRHGDDFAHPIAAKKITQYKTLHKIKIDVSEYIQEISQLIVKQHESESLSLVILNTVDDAIAIRSSLQKLLPLEPIKLLHGRFRGCERNQISMNLSTFKGIVVSTQVIEAGIDLDARRLFTMPCPWASFVQRCGRAGRNGSYAECDITLLDIPNLNPLPYQPHDFSEFYDRLNQIHEASIATLLAITPPEQRINGSLLKAGSLLGLFDSYPSADNSTDDVTQYIRGEMDATIGILWRNITDSDLEVKPHEIELCKVRLRRGLSWLASLKNIGFGIATRKLGMPIPSDYPPSIKSS